MKQIQTVWTCQNCGRKCAVPHNSWDVAIPPEDWLEVGALDLFSTHKHFCSWICVKQHAEREAAR